MQWYRAHPMAETRISFRQDVRGGGKNQDGYDFCYVQKAENYNFGPFVPKQTLSYPDGHSAGFPTQSPSLFVLNHLCHSC